MPGLEGRGELQVGYRARRNHPDWGLRGPGGNPRGTKLDRNAPVSEIIPIPLSGYSSPLPWHREISLTRKEPQSSVSIPISISAPAITKESPNYHAITTYDVAKWISSLPNQIRNSTISSLDKLKAFWEWEKREDGAFLAEKLDTASSKIREIRQNVVFASQHPTKAVGENVKRAGKSAADALDNLSWGIAGVFNRIHTDPSYRNMLAARGLLIFALEQEAEYLAACGSPPSPITAPVPTARPEGNPSPTIAVQSTVSGGGEIRTGSTPTPIQQLDNLKLVSHQGVDNYKKTLPNSDKQSYNQFEMTFKSNDNKYILDLSYILTTASEGLSAQDIGNGQQLLGGVENADLYFWSNYGQARAFKLEKPNPALGNVRQVIFDQWNNRVVYVVEKNGELKRYLSNLQGSNAGKLVLETDTATITPNPSPTREATKTPTPKVEITPIPMNVVKEFKLTSADYKSGGYVGTNREFSVPPTSFYEVVKDPTGMLNSDYVIHSRIDGPPPDTKAIKDNSGVHRPYPVYYTTEGSGPWALEFSSVLTALPKSETYTNSGGGAIGKKWFSVVSAGVATADNPTNIKAGAFLVTDRGVPHLELYTQNKSPASMVDNLSAYLNPIPYPVGEKVKVRLEFSLTDNGQPEVRFFQDGKFIDKTVIEAKDAVGLPGKTLRIGLYAGQGVRGPLEVYEGDLKIYSP